MALSRLIGILFVALLAVGCAPTARVRTLPPSISSVYVPLAVNRTAEPQIEETLTKFVQEEILADGRLDLVSKADASAVVEIELKTFGRKEFAFDADDIPQVVRLMVDSRVSIRENAPDRPRVGGIRDVKAQASSDRDVRQTTFEPEPDALEKVLRELARAIVLEVLTGEFVEETGRP